MKGFETGIFIRTKGTSPADYGCTIDDDSEDQISAAIVVIRTAIANAKSSLPDDPMVQDAVEMIYEFLGSISQFIMILKNSNKDMYCIGLVFSHQGSKLLVKLANVMINPVGKDGEIIPTNISAEERRRRRKRGQEFDVLKMAGNFLKDLGKKVLKDFDGEATEDL